MGWEPFRASVRFVAFLAGCIATGCGDGIALGSECPAFSVPCLERTPRDSRDGAAQRDASGAPTQRDADAPPPRDADAPPARDGGDDGSSEAGPAHVGLGFPAIENASFEITSGSRAGGVVSSLAVQVQPWLSCNAPGVGPGAYPLADLRAGSPSGSPGASEQLAPSEGAALVNASPDGTALAQILGEPMRQGMRYAFMVDLASSLGATGLSLEVQGTNTPCYAPTGLATAGPARAGVWTSLCVTFTPDRDYSTLSLFASSAERAADAHLFIDHIRADPRCE